MRWLLLLAACGRVGFDAAGSGDGGGPPGDGAQSVDSTPSGDGGGGGGTGIPPGVTVVGSAGNGGTMVGVGGGAAGELRVVSVAWQSGSVSTVAITDTAGDTWNQPFGVQTANDLQFAMFYSIASSASNTVTATISPPPSNSAIVVTTFGGQGAFFGQGSGNSSNSSAAQVLWFPKTSGLGVVAVASEVDIGAVNLTPAGSTMANSIRLHVWGTTANTSATIPFTSSGGFDLGELSFQP